MNKKDILNRLFMENNLTEEDVFKHKFYTIITRSGIDKIQSATMGDKAIETYGEASPSNNTNSYPVAMAEKRAMSRAVLKLAGFYEHQVFGEDEAEAFKRSNN